MSKFQKTTTTAPQTKNDTPGRLLNNYYPKSTEKSIGKKIQHVLLWGLMVGVVTAFVAAIAIFTGGAALPAGFTLAQHLLTQFAIGMAEGVLFGTFSEVLGEKQAKSAMNDVYTHLERKKENFREISLVEIEGEKKYQAN
jgi:hypothetical protein